MSLSFCAPLRSVGHGCHHGGALHPSAPLSRSKVRLTTPDLSLLPYHSCPHQSCLTMANPSLCHFVTVSLRHCVTVTVSLCHNATVRVAVRLTRS